MIVRDWDGVITTRSEKVSETDFAMRELLVHAEHRGFVRQLLSEGGLPAASPLQGMSSSGMDGSEFFDFSSFVADDDLGSKAATPDLVQSTVGGGPSPGSGTGPEDVGHHQPGLDTAKIVDPKDGDDADALRLGFWKEVDGGEASYWQSADTNFKWDAPGPGLDRHLQLRH